MNEDIKMYPERFAKYLRKGKWVFCTVLSRGDEGYLVHKLQLSLLGVKSTKDYKAKAHELFTKSVNNTLSGVNKSVFEVSYKAKDLDEVKTVWSEIIKGL